MENAYLLLGKSRAFFLELRKRSVNMCSLKGNVYGVELKKKGNFLKI